MREKRKNISSSENRLRRHDTLRAAQIITSGVKTRGRPLRRGDKFPSSRLGVVTNKTYENRETYSNFSTTILFFGTRGCGFESHCIGLYVPMYSVMVAHLVFVSR